MSDALHDDFAFEPVPGLPERLPAGETMLWQGSPEPIAFAVEVMRLRIATVLVLLLVAWRASAGIHDGIGAGAVLVVAGGTLLGGAIALGLLALAGWAMARGTIYTITSDRLVVRHGVAMPMAINIPFSKVASAAAADGFHGSTSVALTLVPGSRSSLIALWPHTRPGKVLRPEPSLRAIPDGRHVVAILAGALKRTAVAAEAPVSTSIASNVSTTVRPRPTFEATRSAEAV